MQSVEMQSIESVHVHQFTLDGLDEELDAHGVTNKLARKPVRWSLENHRAVVLVSWEGQIPPNVDFVDVSGQTFSLPKVSENKYSDPSGRVLGTCSWVRTSTREGVLFFSNYSASRRT